MSVTSTHPDYDEMSDTWETCRDVADGTRKLREKGERYLPRLSGEDSNSYKARLGRTTLFNATWRTIMGFQGLLFRKPAVIVVPDSSLPLMEDVTASGISLRMLALEITEECLEVSRVGLWVNYPPAAPNMTQADAARLNMRPSIRMCRAESIYNWREERIYNKVQLSQVRLKETVEIVKDEFTTETEDRYRVLDLIPDALGRYSYRVRLFEVNEKDEDVLLDTWVPMMGGQPLDYIPFYFLSTDDVSPEVDEPVFIDLIDINLAHYQLTADYEHGCHWSGLPTPVITGHTSKQGDVLKVGGPDAIVLPNPAAKAMMLEVGTHGFAALEKNLDRKESQMVILGARLLEVQKPGIEAAETALIHRSGEQSILASMASAISTGITQALKTFVRWTGEDDSAVRFDLNREFFHAPLDPTMLTAIVSAWQGGAISAETRFKMLQKGEVYTPDADWATEEAALVPPAGTGGESPSVKQEQPLAEAHSQTAGVLAAILEKMNQRAEPPVVNVAAPIINFPEQPAPTINIAPPAINIAPATINIAPPDITINTVTGDKKITFATDKDGAIVSGTIQETPHAASI